MEMILDSKLKTIKEEGLSTEELGIEPVVTPVIHETMATVDIAEEVAEGDADAEDVEDAMKEDPSKIQDIMDDLDSEMIKEVLETAKPAIVE